jgi:cell division protein FtsL
MNKLETFAQSYAQAPWRKQLQVIGLFSLVLVVLAIVAGVYLTVSARAAAVGRDIQEKQKNILDRDREIEDLQAQLALILSSAEMESRADKLGFKPLAPDQVVYLDIPGYSQRPTAELAPASQRAVFPAPGLPAEYTESLFTWMSREFNQAYATLGVSQ